MVSHKMAVKLLIIRLALENPIPISLTGRLAGGSSFYTGGPLLRMLTACPFPEQVLHNKENVQDRSLLFFQETDLE